MNISETIEWHFSLYKCDLKAVYEAIFKDKESSAWHGKWKKSILRLIRTWVHTCNIPKLIKIDCRLIKVKVHVFIYFGFFSHNFTIESMSRVNFRLPVKIDILVVYKVGFSFQAVGQLTTPNSTCGVCCTELAIQRSFLCK